MVSFENFVKSIPPSLSELKVTPSYCFRFKIPDDPTATTIDTYVLQPMQCTMRFQCNGYALASVQLWKFFDGGS
jgi:hypothetical protein